MINELIKYIYCEIINYTNLINKIDKRKIFKSKNKRNYYEYCLYYYCSIFQVLMNLEKLQYNDNNNLKLFSSDKKITLRSNNLSYQLFNNNFSTDKLLSVIDVYINDIIKNEV